jgi:hypothetical protein
MWVCLSLLVLSCAPVGVSRLSAWGLRRDDRKSKVEDPQRATAAWLPPSALPCCYVGQPRLDVENDWRTIRAVSGE